MGQKAGSALHNVFPPEVSRKGVDVSQQIAVDPAQVRNRKPTMDRAFQKFSLPQQGNICLYSPQLCAIPEAKTVFQDIAVPVAVDGAHHRIDIIFPEAFIHGRKSALSHTVSKEMPPLHPC